MPDYMPVNTDTGSVTLTAGAAITGGLLVTSGGTDDTVVHTTSSTQGRRPIGVAAQDAPSGGRVGVYPLPGYLHAVPAENGSTPVDGDLAIASTTPGRITSVALSSATVAAIGSIVRSTTGSTSASLTTRFLGF